MDCVNISNPEFQQLVKDSGMSQFEMEVTVSLWQSENNVKYFPTLEDLNLGGEQSPPKLDQKIVNRIYEFVNELGFETKSLEDYMASLKIRGKEFSTEGINALIDLNNSVIALGDNASDYDFVEEAAHLGVAIMPKSRQLDRVLELVADTEQYKKNVEGYTARYKELNPELTSEQIETKVRKEILGKLVADNIITNQKEGISYRMFRTLESLWNKLLSIFNSNKAKAEQLNSYIESVTNDMLNKTNRGSITDFNTEGIYFSAEQQKDLKEALNAAIERLEARLTSLRKRKAAQRTTQRVGDTITKLREKLARAEEEQGLELFLGFVQDDVRIANQYINEIRKGDKEVSSNKISQLKEFIDYYMPLLREIKKKNNYSPLFTNYSQERQNEIDNIIRGLISALEDVEDFHTDAHSEMAKNVISDIYSDANVEEDFNKEELFDTQNIDANVIQSWFGSIRDLSSPIARSIYTLVAKAKQKILRNTSNLGKDLINKVINDLGVVDTSKLVETKGSKATGYFLTQYRLAEFYKEYDEFFDKLKEKYKLEEGQREPYDPKKALEFRKEKNAWLSENTERVYTSDYYDMQNDLSLETREALLYIDVQIKDIENKVRTEDGNVDYYLLSDTDLSKLEDLKIDRKRLSKEYNEDGTKKEGKQLEIAKELNAFYEKINKEREFDVKKEQFEKERKVAKDRYTKEEYEAWLKANSEEVYDKAFWNIISNLEKGEKLSDDIEHLKKKRKEILSPFQNGKMEVNLSKVPETTLEIIRDIDKQIQSITNELYENKQVKKDRKKSNIGLYATTETTAEFREMEEKARRDGKIKEFIAKHYYANYKGKSVPYSYATHLVPRHKKYIIKEAKWKELSKDSKFYNDKYDPSWIGMQPSSKWNNSDYNRLSVNEKAALKELLDTKQRMDNKIPVGTRNAYMLPQISKSFNDLLVGGNLNKENLKELLSDEIFSRVDDDEFGNPDERIDGSVKMYVPIYFTKMLENPGNVSTDLVSSVIKYSQMANNYEEMSKIAPDLEIVKEEFGKVKYKKDSVVKSGVETNTYKMIQTFMEMQVYGKQKQGQADITIPLINRKVNVNKLANGVNSYIRGVNLMFNFFTIASGYINGVANSFIEDIVGKYTTVNAKKKAWGEYITSLPEAIKEFKSINKNNKLNVMLEYFRVVDSFDEIFDDLDKSKIKRITKSDIVYFGYGMADYAMKANISLAVMFNYKLYKDKFYTEANFNQAIKNGTINPVEKYGELTSIYDMMEVKNHKLVVKEEFKNVVKESDLNYLDYTINNLATKADGTLTQLDRAKIHQSTWGQLVATHRGWLIDGIARRYKAKGTNLMTGEIEVGYHREFLNILKSTIMEPNRVANLKKLLTSLDEFEPYQKEAVRRAMLEIIAVGIMSVVAKIINNASDDDDDNWQLEALAYLSNRVLLETSALSLTPTPVPYMELLTVLNSPVAGTKQVEQMLDVMDLIWGSEEVERGPYKGMSKRERYILKQIPGVKGSMSLRDPDSANQFLKYKALNWLY
jgi:hypothetical protein